MEAFEKANFMNHFENKSEKNRENAALNYKYINFKCKFHGEHKKTGDIRNTSTYKRGCQYSLSVQQKKRDGTTVLEITNLENVHNHERSAELFKHMPKPRSAAVREKTEYINSSLDVRGNFRLLQSRINEENETSGIVTLRDLYNQKAKLHEEKTHDNDLVRLVEEMMKIPDSIVKIIINDQNELDMVYFQDYRMKFFFEMYPDFIMFDGTYKLNDRRMPLVILLVVDGNGESQIAGLFIVKSENERTFQNLFELFKIENEKHTEVEVIVSDKSFANRNIFAAQFPNASR